MISLLFVPLLILSLKNVTIKIITLERFNGWADKVGRDFNLCDFSDRIVHHDFGCGGCGCYELMMMGFTASTVNNRFVSIHAVYGWVLFAYFTEKKHKISCYLLCFGVWKEVKFHFISVTL